MRLEIINKEHIKGYMKLESADRIMSEDFRIYKVEDFDLFIETLRAYLDKHLRFYTVEYDGYYYLIKSTYNSLSYELFNIDERIVMC